MKIGIIGSGNIAHHLGKAFLNAGHRIVSVYSRTPEHQKKLSDMLGVPAAPGEHRFFAPDAEVLLLAIHDDSLSSVASNLDAGDRLVLHTSGSVPISVLDRFSHYGVLYPLQTLSKDSDTLYKDFPLCVEAGNEQSMIRLRKLATSIGRTVHEIDSPQRKTLHMAAVFACNFTNHLYTIAWQLLKEKDLPFDLLKPLILETAHRVIDREPHTVQTGPASRGDEHVIGDHLGSLEPHPAWKDIYALLSGDIQQTGITNE